MSLVLVTGCAHLANKELKQPTAEKTDSAFNTLLKKAEQGEGGAMLALANRYAAGESAQHDQADDSADERSFQNRLIRVQSCCWSGVPQRKRTISELVNQRIGGPQNPVPI